MLLLYASLVKMKVRRSEVSVRGPVNENFSVGREDAGGTHDIVADGLEEGGRGGGGRGARVLVVPHQPRNRGFPVPKYIYRYLGLR